MAERYDFGDVCDFFAASGTRADDLAGLYADICDAIDAGHDTCTFLRIHEAWRTQFEQLTAMYDTNFAMCTHVVICTHVMLRLLIMCETQRRDTLTVMRRVCAWWDDPHGMDNPHELYDVMQQPTVDNVFFSCERHMVKRHIDDARHIDGSHFFKDVAHFVCCFLPVHTTFRAAYAIVSCPIDMCARRDFAARLRMFVEVCGGEVRSVVQSTARLARVLTLCGYDTDTDPVNVMGCIKTSTHDALRSERRACACFASLDEWTQHMDAYEHTHAPHSDAWHDLRALHARFLQYRTNEMTWTSFCNNQSKFTSRISCATQTDTVT